MGPFEGSATLWNIFDANGLGSFFQYEFWSHSPWIPFQKVKCSQLRAISNPHSSPHHLTANVWARENRIPAFWPNTTGYTAPSLCCQCPVALTASDGPPVCHSEAPHDLGLSSSHFKHFLVGNSSPYHIPNSWLINHAQCQDESLPNSRVRTWTR